jgi:hypothetical protein
MSRFARLQGGPARTWAPPESPLRIEYSPALLREVRIANAGVDAFGTLYGVSHGKTIRVVATRGRAGLDPVGIFASRVRGQVFLTEEDLERFDRAEASVALVISGEKGGFFVRDAGGSIETVRSYEEFFLQGQPAPPPVKVVKRRLSWTWCVALLPLLYFIPRAPQRPLALNLHEDSGQLRISWNIPVDSTLTILDGHGETSVAIHPGQSMITYARRSGDVVVRIGSTQARFVGPELPLTETEQLRGTLGALKASISALKAARASGQTKIAELQRRLQ